MLTTAPAYLSVEQVADRIGVSRETVYRLIWNKQLPATQLAGPGSSWRISERKLTEWLERVDTAEAELKLALRYGLVHESLVAAPGNAEAGP